jgi:hypothetical protein
LPVKKCLRRKQNQDKRHAENREAEDAPGEPKPFALTGKGPRENRKSERDHDREADDPESDEHLGVLGGEPNHAGRRFFGTLEHHQLERSFVRQRSAQQPVIQGVA